MLKPIRNALRRFWQDTRGTLTMELLVVLPAMAAGMTGFYIYWHAYQTQNIVGKATYAVADLLSREMVPATNTTLTGMETTLEYLIGGRNAKTRITSIYRNTGGPSGVTGLAVLWSYSPNSAKTVLTTATLNTVSTQIPMMAVGSNIILYEVEVPYTPPGSVGIDAFTITNTVALRPRFLPKLCKSDVAAC